MESITLAPQERKDLIVGMKRESKPSRRLRMHIVLLVSDGYRPTQIARVLFLLQRTTLYAVAYRFAGEGQEAFDDRQRRGPKPLLDDPASERIERLVEEELPISHGWLRSRWSCSLLMYRSCSKSEHCCSLVEKRLDAPCTALSSAGEDRVRSRPPQIPTRSDEDSKRS